MMEKELLLGSFHGLKKKSGPPSRLLNNNDEVNEFKKQGGVLGAFTDDKSEKFTTFLEVAKDLDDLSFAHSFGASTESVSVVGDNNVEYSGEFTEEDITAWARSEGYPVLVELDQSVWTRSSNGKTTLFVGFIETSNDELKTILRDVAKNFKGKIISTFMDHKQNGQLAGRWGASGNVFPTAIVVSYETAEPKLYAWNEDTEKDYTTAALISFVEQSLAGTYSTNKKSEPIPESNDGPVKVVVYKNFDQIVYDDAEDVLLEFYAPWCGHCKQLAPIYEQLGEKFAPFKTVTIAKIDATANTYPETLNIQGFPTIFLFPAGDKQNPIVFEGERDLAGMTKFIVDNAKGGAIKFEDKEDL